MKKIKYYVKENHQKVSVTGEILEKVLVADKQQITVASGIGGIIINECTQYISVHKFMILRDKTQQIDLIYPKDIISL